MPSLEGCQGNRTDLCPPAGSPVGPTGSSAITPCLQHYLVSWSLGDWVRQRDMNITCDFASFQREVLDQGGGVVGGGRHWDVELWFVQKAILGASHQHCQ